MNTYAIKNQVYRWPHRWLQTGIYYFALLTLVILSVGGLSYLSAKPASAQAGANCTSAYFINETLPNGSSWQMCWEHRNREGIVYYDVYFTPPNGPSRKVLNQANLSQVHVPYDDNGARYHDITDYGFGGNYMNDMVPGDCPSGTLIKYGTKDVLCKRVQSSGHLFRSGGQQLQGHILSIFSVSHVGAYNYIPLWQFYDDGTIEASVGATGKLQRTGTNALYGWPIRSTNTVGISHIHNYYWRLDFDLGGSANDDIVEEFDFIQGNGGLTRTKSVSLLNNETKRSVSPSTMRSWRIRDAAITNSDGHPISYEILPLDSGHRDEGPATEPWTFNDFYVTKYKSCEQFVSHNPTTNGCAADVTGFTNGESLSGADLVLWYGTTFHHIPRDEDEPYMHAHWNGFQIRPRDWTATNPLTQNIVLPTNTPVPATPTATALPLTPTPVTPTATPVAPTSTSLPPTATLVPPTATPGSISPNSYVVYDDAVAAGWSMGRWGNINYQPANSNPVKTGTASLALTHNEAWSTLYINKAQPITAAGYDNLAFWVYGNPGGTSSLRVAVMNSSYVTSNKVSLNNLAPSWQLVRIPLTDFGPLTDIAYLLLENPYSTSQPAIYLDQIVLESSNSLPPTNTPQPQATPTNTPINAPTNTPTHTPQPQATPTNTPVNAPTSTPTTIPGSANGFKIYGDTVALGWRGGTWGSLIGNLNNSTPTKAGTASLSVKYNGAWGTYYLLANQALNASNYANLSFWVYGNSDGASSISVAIMNSAYQTSYRAQLSNLAPGWQFIRIPLADLGPLTDILYILIDNPKTASQPEIYFDEIVLEEGVSSTQAAAASFTYRIITESDAPGTVTNGQSLQSLAQQTKDTADRSESTPEIEAPVDSQIDLRVFIPFAIQ